MGVHVIAMKPYMQFKFKRIKLVCRLFIVAASSDGAIVYDECEMRCQCENGNLVKCCRIRKEFTSMTSGEYKICSSSSEIQLKLILFSNMEN